MAGELGEKMGITERYWVGSAICCYLLVALGAISLAEWTPSLSAILTTEIFLLLFLAAGVLYLRRWRRIVKVMPIVLIVFFVGVFLYWLQTKQFIGVLPSLAVTLLAWQNGKLEKRLMIGELTSVENGPKRNVKLLITATEVRSEISSPPGGYDPRKIDHYEVSGLREQDRGTVTLTFVLSDNRKVRFYSADSKLDMVLLLDELDATIGHRRREVRSIPT